MPRPQILCRPAAGHDEVAVHHRIRHEVFVLEQEVFAASDRDAHDAFASTIKVLAWAATPDGGWEPGGAVRLYPLEPGIWQGDRLAVLPPFRAWNLGGPLVRFAGWLLENGVATQAKLDEMLAKTSAEVDEATEYAESAPDPEPESSLRRVLVEGSES